MDIGATHDGHLVLLLAYWIGRREDAVIYRASLSKKAVSLALKPWDKSNNFAHIRSKHFVSDWAARRPSQAVLVTYATSVQRQQMVA
jgi:hypothetical protein